MDDLDEIRERIAGGSFEFYKDYRNKGLDIHLAMRYVKEQLHGRPAKELEDEVTEWRRTASK